MVATRRSSAKLVDNKEESSPQEKPSTPKKAPASKKTPAKKTPAPKKAAQPKAAPIAARTRKNSSTILESTPEPTPSPKRAAKHARSPTPEPTRRSSRIRSATPVPESQLSQEEAYFSSEDTPESEGVSGMLNRAATSVRNAISAVVGTTSSPQRASPSPSPPSDDAAFFDAVSPSSSPSPALTLAPTSTISTARPNHKALPGNYIVFGSDDELSEDEEEPVSAPATATPTEADDSDDDAAPEEESFSTSRADAYDARKAAQLAAALKAKQERIRRKEAEAARQVALEAKKVKLSQQLGTTTASTALPASILEEAATITTAPPTPSTPSSHKRVWEEEEEAAAAKRARKERSRKEKAKGSPALQAARKLAGLKAVALQSIATTAPAPVPKSIKNFQKRHFHGARINRKQGGVVASTRGFTNGRPAANFVKSRK